MADVVLSNGETVSFRKLLRKEKKHLNLILMPTSFKPPKNEGEKADMTISTMAWEEYRNMIVAYSVLSPSKYKEISVIEELLDDDFEKMFNMANDLNGTTAKIEEIAKK